MKTLILIFSAAAFLQFSGASIPKSFINFKDIRKEDSLHKEPPIFETSNEIQDDTIYEGWVPTKFDNFDPMNNQTFLMRYLMNMDYLVEGGPIFIFVGGEWTISPGTLLRGHFYDMAKNLSGLMIYSEHRYYGYTTPTENLELENLSHLNIDQALADLAHFIVYIKENMPQVRNSGVILVGCSYSGTMVTWFMQKYPHLAQGAWSMSAPLLAKVDFEEYYEVVSEAIHEIGGANCSARIEKAFDEMEELFFNGNYDKLSELFHLCAPLNATNIFDVWMLFGDVASPWAGIAQYASRRGAQLENNCGNLTAITADTDLEAYAEWLMERWDTGVNRTYECYNNHYSKVLEYFLGSEWTDDAAISEWRQWFYQTCAEYGWYQSSNSSNILFGKMFPADSSLQLCQDAYNFAPSAVQRNVDRTNVIYGAMQPNVRQVYSTHGQYDPWSPMGVNDHINDESLTFILPGESHCSDMSSISEWDTPEMKESKERIFELIKKWLGLEDESATPEPTTL